MAGPAVASSMARACCPARARSPTRVTAVPSRGAALAPRAGRLPFGFVRGERRAPLAFFRADCEMIASVMRRLLDQSQCLRRAHVFLRALLHEQDRKSV